MMRELGLSRKLKSARRLAPSFSLPYTTKQKNIIYFWNREVDGPYGDLKRHQKCNPTSRTSTENSASRLEPRGCILIRLFWHLQLAW